jgi:DNA-binding transcriptional LysR family regulator
MKSRLYAHIGTFRQLELLLSLKQMGSIKAAAEELHLAQPTVSMQLKKLTEAVGLDLYEQVGKKIHFTAAGEKVATAAQDLLDRINDLDMELADLKGIKSGTLRLAVVTSSKYFAPHLMGAFSELYPGVDLQLKVGNREQIIERLREDKDDFYIFSHLPEDIKTVNIKFLSNPLIAIAHKDHPLAKKEKVSLKAFCQEKFIMREKGSGTRYAIEQFLQKHQQPLNVKMTIESNEAIKHAVMSGLGVSILSAQSLAFAAGSSEIKRVDVSQLPINTSWYFSWSEKKKLSVAAEAFLNYLADEGQQKIEEMLRNNNTLL